MAYRDARRHRIIKSKEEMDILGSPIQEVDAKLVDHLVTNAVHEDQGLEFKVSLPPADLPGRAEFLKDVSAFANTRGGAIVYGIAANKGIASAVLGLGAINCDAEVLRLEETLHGLQPRITGLVMHRVQHAKGPVLVLGVPRSLAAPHMVWGQQIGQFWGRNNGGKFLMDVTQVRQAMLAAGAWERAAADFRDLRLDRLRRGLGVRALSQQSGTMVLHVLPLGGPRDRVELPQVKPNWATALYPGGATIQQAGYVARPNADGWLVSGDNGTRHVQAFRAGGGVEVRLDLSAFKKGTNALNGSILDGNRLEFEIASWVKRAGIWFESAGIEPPYAVFLSLLSVEGATFMNSNPQTQHLCGDYAIDVADILLPEQMLDRLPDDAGKTLAPTFDAMWQATSWPRSAARGDDGSIFYAAALHAVMWPT